MYGGNEGKMNDNKKVTPYDVITCLLSIPALIINYWIYFIMFKEQMKTGWGFSTRYEMLVLGFWFLQWLTVPLILFGIIYLIYSFVKLRFNNIFFINLSFISLTLIFAILSVIFTFY